MADADQPMPGREEANADLRRVLADARQRELVEVVLDDVSVGDRGRLVHGVVVEPDDLPFDLLFHRQRVDQTCTCDTGRSAARSARDAPPSRRPPGKWAGDRNEPSTLSRRNRPGGGAP